MSSIKVMAVFGTRPEAIKMAPVIEEIKRSSHLRLKVVVTAQHREMLDQVLRQFKIKKDYDLNIMLREQSLAQITTRVLIRLERIIEKEKPKLVLVQGDTTTALAASLTSFYHKTPLAHIEAGLRTEDKYRPFPEEVNRQLTDYLSDLHFAPTNSAKRNLLKMGIKEDSIYVTGNTVIDALLKVARQRYVFPKDWQRLLSAQGHEKVHSPQSIVHRGQRTSVISHQSSVISEKWEDTGAPGHPIGGTFLSRSAQGHEKVHSPQSIVHRGQRTPVISHQSSVISEKWEETGAQEQGAFSQQLILVTAHRRENLGRPLEQICIALKEISKTYPDLKIIFSLHKNPLVRKKVRQILKGCRRIYLVEPIDYQLFVNLMKKSYIILTDSGGIQEEAPSLGRPVLVLRDKTERPEAVSAGTVRLVGTNPSTIIDETKRLLEDRVAYRKMSKATNPYGDGKAAKRIVKVLLSYLGISKPR